MAEAICRNPKPRQRAVLAEIDKDLLTGLVSIPARKIVIRGRTNFLKNCTLQSHYSQCLPCFSVDKATAVPMPLPVVCAVVIVSDVMASCVVCALMVVSLDVVMYFAVISFLEVTFEVLAFSVVCIFLVISINSPTSFAVVCLMFGVFVGVTTENKMFVHNSIPKITKIYVCMKTKRRFIFTVNAILEYTYRPNGLAYMLE